MSKQINIGGRIHSTEVGNVSVGANEVFDDTKGKKQNVINSETDAELLRLDQSKQNNLTFDNTPTENSTNPVTSGGVYAANITLHELIEAILVLIPSAASALNQLADKAFVNSSVSTATATFRGTYNVVTDLELAYDATHEQIATKLGQVIATADNNDYAFVQVPVSATSTDIRRTERYKFNGTVWGYEYDLNTSGFTAAQWEAINSGITALLVSKLTNLPTAEVLATMFNAKQNVLTFDASPTALSTNPVYSGGVYAAIKAITDLIPSEATALNQLADKAYVLASILAATPAFKGQFTSLADLLDVASPKAGDLGIVRTKDSDGYDVFMFYQYLNNQWNVYFSLSYHPQTKPATTGTTGDYPYNGMGRVELPMNIVEGVNTLTQSMMPTATGGNTIYVIQYDFTLGENITVPANCVLEFDGGSISGAYTITGNKSKIIAGNIKAFHENVGFDGTWIGRFNTAWFGLVSDDRTFDNAPLIQKALRTFEDVFIPTGTYYCSTTIDANPHTTGIRANMRIYFYCYGTLEYITQDTNNRFIQIGSTGGNIYIKEIFGPNHNITGNDEKSVGVSLYDCQYCIVNIGKVGGFYKDVECLGGSFGFAYNDITIQETKDAIIQIHLNTNSEGWLNSNRFKFLSMTNYGGNTKADTAILVKGENNATFNDNVIAKASVESFNKSGAGSPIKLYGVSEFKILETRDEGNNSPFIETHNGCYDITYEPGYARYNANAYSIKAQGSITYSKPLKNSFIWSPLKNVPYSNGVYKSYDGYNLNLTNGIDKVYGLTYYPINMLFDRSIVNVPMVIDVPTRARIFVSYYNSEKTKLNASNYSDYRPAANTGWEAAGVDSTSIQGLNGNTRFTIVIQDLPNEVQYIAIGFVVFDTAQYYNGMPEDFEVRVSSNKVITPLVLSPKAPTEHYTPYASGATSKRVHFDIIGFCYFDTDLGKPIWYKGSNVWVDATGATV